MQARKASAQEKDFINTQSKKYDRQDKFPDGVDVWKVIWQNKKSSNKKDNKSAGILNER